MERRWWMSVLYFMGYVCSRGGMYPVQVLGRHAWHDICFPIVVLLTRFPVQWVVTGRIRYCARSGEPVLLHVMELRTYLNPAP